MFDFFVVMYDWFDIWIIFDSVFFWYVFNIFEYIIIFKDIFCDGFGVFFFDGYFFLRFFLYIVDWYFLY